MARLLKEITIVEADEGTRPSLVSKTKTYRSYRAIAKVLKDKECVTVEVLEYMSCAPKSKILAGYGRVEIDGDTFYSPRRLNHEY